MMIEAAIMITVSCLVISTQLLLDIFIPPSLSVIDLVALYYTNSLIRDNSFRSHMSCMYIFGVWPDQHGNDRPYG